MNTSLAPPIPDENKLATSWPDRSAGLGISADIGDLEVCLQLPVAAEASLLARRQLDASIASKVSEETMDELRLLVTELVSNSVRHASCSLDDKVMLDVEVGEEDLHVCVSDNGPGFTPEFRCDSVNGGGFGLYLVHRLAKHWGVVCNGGTSVWFILQRFPAAVTP